MERLKKLLKTKKFILWSIFVVTILIFVGFFWLIYHNDQPKIVPPETRGKIREGVKEEVVKPIQSVWPSGGKVLSDAAYGSGSVRTSVITISENSSAIDTSSWKTFKDDSLGVQFKYPEDCVAEREEGIISVNPIGDTNMGAWIYTGATSLSLPNYWEAEKQKYDGDISEEETLVSGNRALKVTIESGLTETHYYFVNNGKFYDVLLIGPKSISELIAELSFN